MALSTIRTKVANIVNRDDIPDTAGGLIDGWINDAQRRVCRAYNFAFMESEATASTVDEQQNYALPTASGDDLRFKSEISLELVNSYSYRVGLKRLYKQDLERKAEYLDTTDYGEPRYYSIQKGQIYLFPTPDHTSNAETAWTLNLEYYGYLDDLSEDTDSNDLVSYHPDALVALASADAFRYAHEEEKAEYWESKGKNYIEEMIREEQVNTHGNLEEGMEPEDGAGTSPRY